MVLKVEIGIVDPHRMPFDRDVPDHLPIARDQVETRGNMGTHEVDLDAAVGIAEIADLEDRDPGDVHVARRRFEGEERTVLETQSVVVAACQSLLPARRRLRGEPAHRAPRLLTLRRPCVNLATAEVLS